MSRSIAQFKFLLNKADRVSDDCWNVTTAKRKTLIVPTGFKLFDTDLKILFLGDGVTYGGIPVDGREGGRTIVTAAASAFTSNDTFITITKAEDGVFTAADHGFSVGTKIIPMATNADYKVTLDTVYTVATAPTDNTFTLAGVTPGDRTANLVVKVYSIANNNYVTWDQAANLRTGDAVTVAKGSSGTLPSGLTNSETYYIVKDDSADNGGLEKNTTTKFRFSDSREHALAGTHIVTIRDAGTTGFTAVIADVYLTNADKTVFASFGVAADIFLPDGEEAGLGKSFEINNSGTADCTVKSEGGKVMGANAATGKRLKASSNDFIVVKSDGTNWCAFGAQITPDPAN
jgi:hypothetical protein